MYLIIIDFSTIFLFGLYIYRTVPVELGRRYTDDEWSQKLLPINDFITSYIEPLVREPSERFEYYH